MDNWEQDPTGIFSDKQRAAIGGAAPVLGEEFIDLLLRLATEVPRVAAAGRAVDVQNAVLDQLAKLREEVAVREQEVPSVAPGRERPPPGRRRRRQRNQGRPEGLAVCKNSLKIPS
jgi:hypothetical protein